MTAATKTRKKTTVEQVEPETRFLRRELQILEKRLDDLARVVLDQSGEISHLKTDAIQLRARVYGTKTGG